MSACRSLTDVDVDRMAAHVRKVCAAAHDLETEVNTMHHSGDGRAEVSVPGLISGIDQLQETKKSPGPDELPGTGETHSLPRQVGSESMDSGYESAVSSHRHSVVEDGEILEEREPGGNVEPGEIMGTSTDAVQPLSPTSPRSSLGMTEVPVIAQLDGQDVRHTRNGRSGTPRKVSLPLKKAVEANICSKPLSQTTTAAGVGPKSDVPGTMKRQREENDSDSDDPLKHARRGH